MAEPVETINAGFGHVPPLTYRGPDRRPAGFAIDVLNEAARREGIRLNWRVGGRSDEIEERLGRGELDVMPAAMVTPDRKRAFYVSEPWWFAELMLLVRAEGPLRTTADLSGRRLALGSPLYRTLTERSLPPMVYVQARGPVEGAAAVCAGRADAALMSFGEVRELVLARPPECHDTNMRAIDTPVVAELAVMANRAKEGKARQLRRQIDEMALDGTLSALAARHPAVPTSGAVRLAETVKQRYERRMWKTASLSLAALVSLGSLFLLSRRRARRSLADSEARYRRFFHQAAVGTCEVDPATGRFLNMNDKFCEMLGYSRQELFGTTFLDVTHPDDRDASMKCFQNFLRENSGSYSLEMRYVRKDGTPIWVRLEASSLRGPAGAYVIGVVKDISDRKRSEEALRKSEERYRVLVEANPVGVAFASIAGPDYGRLYHVNQAYAEIVGYSREEIESGAVRWPELTPPEWAAADERAIREAFQEGRSRLYEKEYVRRDGTRVPILLAWAVAGENGEAAAFVLNVSDRERLEKQVSWLSGLLPICAGCKQIRDENGEWHQLETYMNNRISADFSHSLCPKCLPKYMGMAGD